jgi:hypothetical protein
MTKNILQNSETMRPKIKNYKKAFEVGKIKIKMWWIGRQKFIL